MKRNGKPDKLSLPQQKYVETIYDLTQKHGHAHCVQIARRLGVRKPSVTEAVNRLVKLKIAEKNDQEVVLSEAGSSIARELSYRHETLRRFMIDVLRINASRADEMACVIEHSAEPEFIRRLLLLDEFLQSDKAEDLKKQWTRFLSRKSKDSDS